jgi:hypothetical protein
MAIITVLLFQFGWFLLPDLNILTDSYRYQERSTALKNWAINKTSETTAAWQNERHLLYVHRQNKAIIVASSFLIIDAIAFAWIWK